MNETIDLGHFALGSAPTFTFVFKQARLATNPAVAPVLNVTHDMVKTVKSLTHAGDGTYTWTPLLDVPGFYAATVYAPAGSGQTAQRFTFAVDPDPNYP